MFKRPNGKADSMDKRFVCRPVLFLIAFPPLPSRELAMGLMPSKPLRGGGIFFLMGFSVLDSVVDTKAVSRRAVPHQPRGLSSTIGLLAQGELAGGVFFWTRIFVIK